MESLSDTDENFDHHLGLSSPTCSDRGDEEEEGPAAHMVTDLPHTGGMSSEGDKVTDLQGDTDSIPDGPSSPIATKLENAEMSPEVSQLQEMLGEMRSGFSTAMHTLAEIQYGDQALEQKVESNKVQYERQLADVLGMVSNLKTEFSKVLGQLQQATSGQRNLQSQVMTLQSERDILLEELQKAGAISKEVREKYHSGCQRPSNLRHSASLSALIDQTRHYSNHLPAAGDGSQNSIHVTSDQDSGVNSEVPGTSCDDSPTTFSPIMHSYIAGLKPAAEVSEVEDQYASDSSITAAANRSLDLSRSLGDELDLQPSEDEEGEQGKGERQINKGVISEDILEPSFKKPDTPKKVAPHERNANEIQRSNIARELLSTEKKYCSSLWILLDTFAAPLKTSGFMGLPEISLMFPPSLAHIYDHHCSLLQALEQRLSSCKWQCVLGDILARFIQDSQCQLLKQYQNYMRDFPGALQLIRKNMHINPAFRRFIKDVQRLPCCENLDVGAFLLTPVQRMPRYVLLLKQLLKVTEVDHPDHYYLETSLHHLASFLNTLNSSIEHSIQLVTSQEPKPKRRFRMPSFRQSSVTSVDGIQDGPPRVAGFFAHRSHKSASAIGGSVKPSSETIYRDLDSPASLQAFPYSGHYSQESFMEEGVPQTEAPASRQGVSGRQRKNPSSHKPRRGRKDKHNGGGSGGATGALTHSSSFTSSLSGSQYSTDAGMGSSNGRVSGGTRPLSMGEEAFAAYSNGIMDHSVYHPQNSSMHPTGAPPPHHFGGFTQHASAHLAPPHLQYTSTSTPYNSAKSHAHHYGVFGDVDSDTDADISSSTNNASVQSPRVIQVRHPAQQQTQYYPQRQRGHHPQGKVAHPSLRELRSQSCMDMSGSIVSPTQEHINAALARSLTFKASCQTLPSHSELAEQEVYEPSWTGEDSDTTQRSGLDGSLHRFSLNESTMTSQGNSTLQLEGVSRKDVKKKRGKLTSGSESDLLDGSLARKKRPTLKQSIKNIFFRKSRMETDCQDNQNTMATTQGVISEVSTKVVQLRRAQNGSSVGGGSVVARQLEEHVESVEVVEEDDEEECSAV